jgi:hypothetical protein
MNERIKELAIQAGVTYDWDPGSAGPEVCFDRQEDFEKFAELIIAECKKVALGEIVQDTDIDSHSDPLLREYLKGNNGGVVDSIVAIQQHFYGVEE